MGEPIKQLTATYDDSLIVPELLERTVFNYKKAHYGYKFDDKEQAYIEYNTLREQRKETEEVTIQKIQRLYDRDTQKQRIVYFQSSRVKDFNNNYVKCPVVEKLGVAPEPISNISNDAQNRIKDLKIIETKNDYYIPFSKEKLIELFESSKDRHKIVCYVGFTRPTRVHPSDTIEGKKIIWNQDKFVNANFSELIDKDEDVQAVLDERTQYIIPNKVRDVSKPKQLSNTNRTQRVESLSELLPSTKKKSKETVQQEEAEELAYETIKEYEDREDEIRKESSNNTTNEIVNDTQKEFDELISNK